MGIEKKKSFFDITALDEVDGGKILFKIVFNKKIRFHNPFFLKETILDNFEKEKKSSYSS